MPTNLILRYNVKLIIESLQEISSKIQDLCKETQVFYDKISKFAESKSRNANSLDQEARVPQISQCDILNDKESGIIQRTCILHLELLLVEELFTKLMQGLKEFVQNLHTKLVALNPKIDEMDLDSAENIQFLNELRM